MSTNVSNFFVGIVILFVISSPLLCPAVEHPEVIKQIEHDADFFAIRFSSDPADRLSHRCLILFRSGEDNIAKVWTV